MASDTHHKVWKTGFFERINGLTILYTYFRNLVMWLRDTGHLGVTNYEPVRHRGTSAVETCRERHLYPVRCEPPCFRQSVVERCVWSFTMGQALLLLMLSMSDSI